MRLIRCAAMASLAVLVSACVPRALIVQGMADGLASLSLSEEDDLTLAREAAAFYLKLSESVLQAAPGHHPLAETVASSFTKYAYAFVAFDAERLEATDARAAMRLRQRAARLYERARHHAMRALEQRQPGFSDALADASRTGVPVGVAPENAALAYWAAASWGAHIALSKDQPESVANLPQVLSLAAGAHAVSPNLGDGALASLMGTLEAARPGGNLAKAQTYFSQAMTASLGRSAAVLIARAEALAQPAGDRVGYAALLQQALAVRVAPRDMEGQVMQLRAQWLLDTIDDRF
ncbi:MAG: hypothetical protein CFE45_22455 [Burkholderiales bacterium PBB5]|nr:MAG: hypothetical protein CFE45_22455 [Burkholderiales bacterium PBB5]